MAMVDGPVFCQTRILRGEWDFEAFPSRWVSVSDGAKNLVGALLSTDPKMRMSADTLASHTQSSCIAHCSPHACAPCVLRIAPRGSCSDFVRGLVPLDLRPCNSLGSCKVTG